MGHNVPTKRLLFWRLVNVISFYFLIINHIVMDEFIRPRLPEKEIDYCIQFFSKEEATKRILDYIKSLIDDAEQQFNNKKL